MPQLVAPAASPSSVHSCPAQPSHTLLPSTEILPHSSSSPALHSSQCSMHHLHALHFVRRSEPSSASAAQPRCCPICLFSPLLEHLPPLLCIAPLYLHLAELLRLAAADSSRIFAVSPYSIASHTCFATAPSLHSQPAREFSGMLRCIRAPSPSTLPSASRAPSLSVARFSSCGPLLVVTPNALLSVATSSTMKPTAVRQRIASVLLLNGQ